MDDDGTEADILQISDTDVIETMVTSSANVSKRHNIETVCWKKFAE